MLVPGQPWTTSPRERIVDYMREVRFRAAIVSRASCSAERGFVVGAQLGTARTCTLRNPSWAHLTAEDDDEAGLAAVATSTAS